MMCVVILKLISHIPFIDCSNTTHTHIYIYIYYDILRYIYIYVHYIHIYIYTSGPYCIFQRGPTSFWSLESCFFPILLCRRTPCCSSQWKGPRQLPRMWDDPWVIETYIYIYISLLIQTLSEKVLNPPNYSKLYPKHFLRRYLDPMGIFIYIYIFIIKPSFSDEI